MAQERTDLTATNATAQSKGLDSSRIILPARCCGRCHYWTRKQPDDLTAPEGHCGKLRDPGHWPTGYWPATLQRDGCPKFKSSTTMPAK